MIEFYQLTRELDARKAEDARARERKREEE